MSSLIALVLAAALAGPQPCSNDETINLITAWQHACPAATLDR